MGARGSLPSGLLTLVFTDIEGSTKLLQELGERYPAVVEQHRAIMREAFKRWNGFEQGTEGDSFFVVFTSTSDAIAALVEVQRRLAEHPWPEGVSIRVRAGAHAGEPVVVEADYYGLDVHRAARIASAAHGGQVLVSQRTIDLCPSLPDGVSVRDLGEHRLKDIDEAEHLYQLVIQGLPAVFPPIKSLATPTNLPAEPAPLIGRERESDEIVESVSAEHVRLVTLTGPGGTGKTRLATHVARRLLDSFKNGVHFVSLGSVEDAAAVPAAIEAALDLPPAGGVPALDNVVRHVRDRTVLLVLDNFEHVTEAAGFVATLLAGAPKVKAIATSRAPLRIGAEREYPLSPLSLPPRDADADAIGHSPAVALFVERARAVKPGFALTAANAPAVAEICARLDGLPLAIELAAARARILSPQQILTRLGERLTLLTGGARDVPARQQTLRDAIAWSYDLLDAPAASLFRRLGVFTGGATLEAAEAIGSDLDDALALLSTLADQSLIRHDDEAGRFAMLETIRDYALSELQASGDAPSMRARHAAYFAALAEEAEPGLRGAEQAHWRGVLQAEEPNLRSALAWTLEGDGDRATGVRLALALGWFWYMRGSAVEGSRWLDAAYAAAGDAPVDVRAKLAHRRGILLDQRADTGAATKVLSEAVELFRAAGDRRGEAGALNSLGSATRGHGDVAAAAMHFEQSLEIRRALGDLAGAASVVFNLGEAALDRMDVPRARELFKQAEELDRQCGDEWGLALDTSAFGIVALYEGDVGEAGRLLREALRTFVDVGDEDRLAESLSSLAGEAAARGDLARCARLGGAADALWERLGLPLKPLDRAHFERHLERARAELPAPDFTRAWEEGRAMTTGQAVGYALEPA